MTKETDNYPNIELCFRVSDVLNIEPLQPKNEDDFIIVIPNDAIYWLIPLDGHDPVKFKPIENSKASGSGGSVTVTCDCWESTCNKFGSGPCEKRYYSDNTIKCAPKTGECCTWCKTITTATTERDATPIIIVGSSYLIQSDIITIDGITYE